MEDPASQFLDLGSGTAPETAAAAPGTESAETVKTETLETGEVQSGECKTESAPAEADTEEPAAKRVKTEGDVKTESAPAACEEDGEPMHFYSPCAKIPGLAEQMDQVIEVVVLAKYMTEESRQLRLRQLWGTDTYTDDSDLVAMLVHSGHLKLKSLPKHPLKVCLRVCGPQTCYTSSDKNGIRSRDWGSAHPGCSLKVESCAQYTGKTPPEPTPTGPLKKPLSSLHMKETVGSLPNSAFIFQFSLANEPWFKYSLALVADRGLDPEQWTSTRLRTEALYLENMTKRYEIIRKGSAKGPSSDTQFDTYQLAEVLNPQLLDQQAMETEKIPLPEKHLTVLQTGLDWEDFNWGHCSVQVGTEEIRLMRIQWTPHTNGVKTDAMDMS